MNLGQGYSITNSVGPDFQTKKVNWASYFSGEAARNNFFLKLTQTNLLKNM